MSQATRSQILQTHKFSVILKVFIPHYSRANVPPELSVKLMFEQFQESLPNVNCKERTYWRLLKEMNVGFAKLGEEECEDCREFSLHFHKNVEIELTGDVKGLQEGQGKTVYTPPR